MAERVAVTRSGLDSLAEAVAARGGAALPLTIEQMREAVLSIEDGARPSGTKRITSNGTHDVAGYAKARVDVRPRLQEKDVESLAEVQVVVADAGYDGLSRVNVGAFEPSLTDVTVIPGRLGKAMTTPTGDVVWEAHGLEVTIPAGAVDQVVEMPAPIPMAEGELLVASGLALVRRDGEVVKELLVGPSGGHPSYPRWQLRTPSAYVMYDIGVQVVEGSSIRAYKGRRNDLDVELTVVIESLYAQEALLGYDGVRHVRVEPIPSNYGLVTWDGSVITVS